MDRDDALTLLDYRRRVAELYREVRALGGGERTWDAWRRARDGLFATHRQSPVPAQSRAAFDGLHYFPYDPSLAFDLELEPVTPTEARVEHSGEGATPFTAIGRVGFEHRGASHALTVYWLDAYGGGLFLPFRDATSGDTTYGGGRYLLDTVKSADLGSSNGRLVIDFNFSYHPSCVHDPRWSCPLAPSENWLDVPIEAGERLSSPTPGSSSV